MRKKLASRCSYPRSNSGSNQSTFSKDENIKSSYMSTQDKAFSFADLFIVTFRSPMEAAAAAKNSHLIHPSRVSSQNAKSSAMGPFPSPQNWLNRRLFPLCRLRSLQGPRMSQSHCESKSCKRPDHSSRHGRTRYLHSGFQQKAGQACNMSFVPRTQTLYVSA